MIKMYNYSGICAVFSTTLPYMADTHQAYKGVAKEGVP